MQRASSFSHEAEGDRELSSTGGRRPRILTARDNVQSRSPSAKCCELYASLHERFRLEVRILFYITPCVKCGRRVRVCSTGRRQVM